METRIRTAWTPPHAATLALTCLLAVLLNAFDALATLEIVRRGGEEANPLAEPMLERGAAAFLSWKLGIAAICSVALALISRKRRAAWILFRIAVVAYAALAALHVYLLWFASRPH
jgi:hypothetical protein